MKKYLSYLGASLVAIAAFSSCNKELTDPNEGIKGGIPFEITAASVDTRTSIDGVTTSWVAGDAINLFHAAAGKTTYTSDGQFTITSENLAANKFTGTLAAALEVGNYDWYAFYPYDSHVSTPASTSSGYVTVGGTSQTQTGNSSTAHLCGKPCPLYGVAKAVASDVAPSIVMNHLASIVEVNVTNNSGEDLTVTSVSFTGTEDIVGTYYIDFTKTPIVYTPSGDKYVSSTASLSVTDGEAIAAKSSATFYIAIKPFTATNGQTLKVSVNGYEKDIPLTKDVSFTAGKIKTINFNFDKVVVDYVTLPWSIDGTGGSSVYSSTPGLSAFGLGSDYASANSPYFTKFDTTNDYILIKTDSQIGSVTIGVKMIGGATSSSFDIQGSEDGNTFTTVQKLTISGTQNSIHDLTTTESFDEKYRFVKLLFNKGSNIGVGPVSITKPDNTPALVMNDITNVPATGVSDAIASYTIKNAEDDVIISEFSGCVSAASASAGTVTYSVSPNYSSASTTGTIVLVSSSNSELTKTISVSQLKSTLEVSDYEVIIPATSTESSFTVTTPEFGYNTTITVAEGMNLTISSGDSGANSTNAQTITVTSTTSAPTEGSAIVLGTIKVYRNDNTEDIQAKTVTIKKDVVSNKYYQKVSSITSGNTYLIVGGGTTSPAKIMKHPATTAATVGYVDATVTDNQIAASTEVDACAVTITQNGEYYTITFDSNYIAAVTDKTSLQTITTAPSSSSTNNANWIISATTSYGSFQIKNSKQSSRAILWRSGSTNKFGDYSTTNTLGSEYYNIDLYELAN